MPHKHILPIYSDCHKTLRNGWLQTRHVCVTIGRVIKFNSVVTKHFSMVFFLLFIASKHVNMVHGLSFLCLLLDNTSSIQPRCHTKQVNMVYHSEIIANLIYFLSLLPKRTLSIQLGCHKTRQHGFSFLCLLLQNRSSIQPCYKTKHVNMVYRSDIIANISI